jgi:hypothetical protein
VKALRAQQNARMTEIRKLHQQFGNALKRGTAVYVEAIERERPNNPRMHAFRERLLLPLACWNGTLRGRTY